MNRRDFTRNVARFGIVGALALFLGVKKAEANTCFYQYTPVSACQSYEQYCCSGWGCGTGWYTSHNNCAYYGKPSGCCG